MRSRVTRMVGAVGATLVCLAAAGSAVATADVANLVPNPSMETVSGSVPSGWSKGSWGTNTASFSYLSTGCQDGSRCLSVTLANRTSGDAKWYFAPVAVTPGASYTISDWFQSTVGSEVDAVVTDSVGRVSYLWLGSQPASSTWRQASYSFTAPANATKVTVYHVISVNGTLKTDAFAVTASGTGTPTPTPTTSSPTPTTSSPTTSTTTTSTTTTSTTTTSTTTTFPPTAPTTPPSPAPGNVIPNPGLEVASGAAPQSWSADAWGTNRPTFTYLATGHSGGRSARVSVTNYVSGSANWDYPAQPVTAGAQYLYSDWYQSSVTTEIDAAVTMASGSVSYYHVANVAPSTAWAQAKAPFQVPAGATKVAIYHLLAADGWLTTDDYSLTPYAPSGLSRGLVSVTLDDGWTNQYTNGLPVLTRYGVPATFYIISGTLTEQPAYMTGAQVQALAAAGHEIGSHTISHPDLTKASTAALTDELSSSRATLQGLIGAPVTDFAYPYGAYNATTINAAKPYYASQRTVDTGYNTKDLFDPTRLKVQNVFDSTTPAQVQAWVNQAEVDRSWLILVYHEVANTPSDPTNTTYTTKPADFDAEMAAVRGSALGKVTVRQGLAEVLSQL